MKKVSGSADGGTVFLIDRRVIAGLPVKLLRVLQEREFERVGWKRTIKVDIAWSRPPTKISSSDRRW